MGFNLRGIATSKKYYNYEKLFSEIGLKDMRSKGEVFFETASSSLRDNNANDAFITAVSAGTIITFGDNYNVQELDIDISLKNEKVLKFIVSETSMAFLLEYFENGERKRRILNVMGAAMDDFESPLEIENTISDITDLIFYCIKEVTGDNLYSIAPDYPSECFTPA